MVIIYNAATSLDANMIKGLLTQYNIRSFVQGEYLQGGAGELPTAGLVTVSVINEHVAQAKQIINEWEAGSIVEEAPNTSLVDGDLSVAS